MIGAGIGAIFGGISAWNESQKQKRAIEEQKRVAREQYRIGKEASDAQYGIQMGQAYKELDKTKQRLDQSVDQNIEGFNTNLLAQAYGIQDASISTQGQVGAYNAGVGMSGTRGSGTDAMVTGYAEQSLARNIDIQNQQNDQYLQGMIGSANNANQDIIDERQSWVGVGYRNQMKQAQDEYNKEMSDLGISSLDWQEQQVDDAMGMNILSGALGGAASGWSMGSSIGGSIDYARQQNTQGQTITGDYNYANTDGAESVMATTATPVAQVLAPITPVTPVKPIAPAYASKKVTAPSSYGGNKVVTTPKPIVNPLTGMPYGGR